MQLEPIIIAGALGTLLSGAIIVLLLRTFYIPGISCAKTSEEMDLSWRDYRPLHRLLDPADFEFLRRRGIGEARIKKLIVERRGIYRLCLRSLASDFKAVHRTLNMVLIQSRVDRPDLAAELAKQRLTFYRNLMLVEFRLAVHRWGFKMPSVDLLQPLEVLQTQLRMLAAAGAAA
jgi:hypothetical protein